jgi:hypothetical protein
VDIHLVLITFHIIGVALGVGGATVSDYLFFRAIRNGVISKEEFNLIGAISHVVWTGLFVLVFSGTALLLFSRLGYGAESIFEPGLLAHISVFIILFFNGFFMHTRVFPLLSARLDESVLSSEFIKKSKFIFISGAISIVSWYTALILGALRGLELSYIQIMFSYLVVLLVAIYVSLFLRKVFIKKLSQ